MTAHELIVAVHEVINGVESDPINLGFRWDWAEFQMVALHRNRFARLPHKVCPRCRFPNGSHAPDCGEDYNPISMTLDGEEAGIIEPMPSGAHAYTRKREP